MGSEFLSMPGSLDTSGHHVSAGFKPTSVNSNIYPDSYWSFKKTPQISSLFHSAGFEDLRFLNISIKPALHCAISDF